ncbi:MAG: hypothetical protein P4L36_00360 [Holophaga sp.]|nr:hypothetical protein [Holophaga sp.]
MVPLGLGAQSPLGNLITGQSRTGLTVEGAGARALGMGGAFIAVADDATAATFNPAGLAQLLKPELSFVGQGLDRRVSYEEFQTTTKGKQLGVSDSLLGHDHFDPLLLSAMVPLRLAGRNLAIQLSAQRAYTMGEGDSRHVVETPLSSGGKGANLDQSIQQSGQVDLYSLSMAYECSQRILLGLTFNQWRGRWDLDTVSQETKAGVNSSLRFRQQNQLNGQNFTLGLLWRWPAWSLGLVHSTAFQGSYSFQTQINTTLPVPGSLASSSASVGLHWPESTGLGLAFRVSEKLLVTADIEHTAWSRARFVTSAPNLNGLNFFDLSQGSQGQDATVLRLGMEKLWLSPNGLLIPFRLGASREPQPVVDPVTGDQRIMYGLSLGSGLKRGRYTWDLGYRYAWAKRQASQFLDLNQVLAGTHTSSVGIERTTEQRLEMTFIMQFERERVDRMLNYLFVGD